MVLGEKLTYTRRNKKNICNWVRGFANDAVFIAYLLKDLITVVNIANNLVGLWKFYYAKPSMQRASGKLISLGWEECVIMLPTGRRAIPQKKK